MQILIKSSILKHISWLSHAEKRFLSFEAAACRAERKACGLLPSAAVRGGERAARGAGPGLVGTTVELHAAQLHRDPSCGMGKVN